MTVLCVTTVIGRTIEDALSAAEDAQVLHGFDLTAKAERYLQRAPYSRRTW